VASNPATSPIKRRTDDPVDVARPKHKPRTRRPRPPEHPNHERWLVSYADFITLLFAVFAMMYALSVVDAKKFAAMAQSLKAAFNETSPSDLRAGGSLLPNEKNNPPSADKLGLGGIVELGDVRTQLQSRLKDAIAANQVDMTMDHRGLVISIREAGSFATSRAELSSTAQDILAKIGLSLAKVGNSVRIEGHTDEVPIHTDRFASNWELSTARATTVVRFMLERAGLKPQRLSAAGYAEYMPRVSGTSESARARNRRVDLIVLSAPTRAAEEPAAPKGQPPAP